MSKSNHTPGPWSFREGRAERCEASTVHKASDPDFVVALVQCEWSNRHQRASDIANARLIAAAPEMLIALHQAADWIERIEIRDEGGGRLRDHLRGLIARIKG